MSDCGLAVSYCNGLAPPPRDVTDQQPSGRSYYGADEVHKSAGSLLSTDGRDITRFQKCLFT